MPTTQPQISLPLVFEQSVHEGMPRSPEHELCLSLSECFVDGFTGDIGIYAFAGSGGTGFDDSATSLHHLGLLLDGVVDDMKRMTSLPTMYLRPCQLSLLLVLKGQQLHVPV